MNIVTEQLKFREAVYPQLIKLPKGTRFVKQGGFPEIRYCAYTLRGNLIAINLGNSIKVAKKNTLNVLNKKLREQNLVWGNDCKKEKYLQVIL